MGTLLTYLCSMLTKYYIEIDGVKAEVPKGCLKNWDEIKCVYKRSDFSGVTRSFTTQFEFVGEMYDRLMALYLRDGVNARAVLSLYTITNEWGWEEQFTCDLDFSSIRWDNNVIRLNCIDDSLAALIKACKGTKYEALIGTEIKSDHLFAFNRLPIKNSITYAFTGGTTNDSDGSLTTDSPTNNRVRLGIVNDEVFVNGLIIWKEDQTDDADSYMLEAHGDVTVNLDIEISSDRCYPDSSSGITSCNICIYKADGTKVSTSGGFPFGSEGLHFCGRYGSSDSLKAAYPHDTIVVNGSAQIHYWAIVNGIVWRVNYFGSTERTDWESTGQTEDQFRIKNRRSGVTLALSSGDKVAIETSGISARIYSSKFTYSWFNKGNSISVPAFSPNVIGQYILNKMCLGHTNARLLISDYDQRLSKTLILAAESIRGIPNAKIYSSFSEFADWMETVFGYTYYLAKREPSKFSAHQNALGGYIASAYLVEESMPWNAINSNLPSDEDIVYFSCYGKFAAYDGNRYYYNFPEASLYNNPQTGYARTDTIFKIKRHSDTSAIHEYYFSFNVDGTFNKTPSIFNGNIEDISRPFQDVVFVHRSEMFNPDASVHTIAEAKELEYSVDTGNIYSSVNIGYEKKDYQNINGRDEYNFNNTYSTGCTVSDKKLTLISKYRADCYGIEFAAQKRGEETTDTTSDNDVFFVYCKIADNGVWLPDSSATIENAISEEVFNGVYSPMACVTANAGYIGMQGHPLLLEFASSDGNSDIIINGQSISSDIMLSAPLMTCGILQFSCNDMDERIDINEIVEVHSNGITYRGFLKEVSFKYARPETVKYKLIVKDIEL